jgi:hypothetical protein
MVDVHFWEAFLNMRYACFVGKKKNFRYWDYYPQVLDYQMSN